MTPIKQMIRACAQRILDWLPPAELAPEEVLPDDEARELFVRRLYQEILGRPPQPENVQYFTGLLRRDLSPLQFRLRLLCSKENRQRLRLQAENAGIIDSYAAYLVESLRDIRGESDALAALEGEVSGRETGALQKLLDADYRQKLEALNAAITLELCEPTTKTQFKLHGPASDRSIFIRIVHRHGRWEPEVTQYLASRLKLGDTFFDLGANLGYYTALAAKLVGPEGQVHAFEASEWTRGFLAETIRLNEIGQTVKVHPIAVWNERRTLVFRKSCGAVGGNHVLLGEAAQQMEKEFVEAQPLDACLKGENLGRLTLVKMDIEGAEIEGILGMRGILETYRPEVVCEVNEHCLHLMDHTLGDFWDLAEQLDYAIFSLGKDAATVPLKSRKAFLAAYPKAEGMHLDVVLRHNQASPENTKGNAP